MEPGKHNTPNCFNSDRCSFSYSWGRKGIFLFLFFLKLTKERPFLGVYSVNEWLFFICMQKHENFLILFCIIV